MLSGFVTKCKENIIKYCKENRKIKFREATKEEIDGISKYIDSISTSTGVSFYEDNMED